MAARRYLTVRLQAADGTEFQTSIPSKEVVEPDYGDLQAVVDALGDISDAGLIFTQIVDTRDEPGIPTTGPYPSAKDHVQWNFVTETGKIFPIRTCAPKEDMFTTSQWSVDLESPGAVAFVDAVLAGVSTPAGDELVACQSATRKATPGG